MTTTEPSATKPADAVPPLTRLHASAGLADMLTAFDRDGGLVVESMISTETIDQLNRDFTAHAQSVDTTRADQGMGDEGKVFVGSNTVRFSSLGTVSDAFFDLLDNQVFAAIADAVLLPNCGSYWVNTGQVMFIGPGETAQVLHRDANNWWQYIAPTWPNSPEITVSAMIALDEVTEELGATRVVPGSHKWESLQRWSDEPIPSVPAEMSPGDAMIYSGNVLHGGGANQTTDQWRKAMHLSFVVGWLTPEEACAIDYTRAELLQRSERVQRLLGHRSYDSRPHKGGGLWLKNVTSIEAWDEPSA